MGRLLEIFKGDEFVFFQILEKIPEAFIQRFHIVAEFFFQMAADFLDIITAIAKIPYKGTDIVQFDLIVRTFQTRKGILNKQRMSVFWFEEDG